MDRQQQQLYDARIWLIVRTNELINLAAHEVSSLVVEDTVTVARLEAQLDRLFWVFIVNHIIDEATNSGEEEEYARLRQRDLE